MKQNVAVIVLANGDQLRWPPGSIPKQLLEVDSVPIILRTALRFEESLQASARVVTRDLRITSVVGGMRVVNVGETPEQLATLLKARSEWGAKRTVCLLGDVYYTDAAIRAISECKKDVAFYGRRLSSKVTGKPYGELVAMAWSSSLDDQMIHSLECWRDRSLLWSPYRDFADLWLPETDNYLHHIPECLTEIDDFTDDFDIPEDWATWNRLRILANLPRDPKRRWMQSGREVPWSYGWRRPVDAPGADRPSTSGYDLQDALIAACRMISPKSYLEVGVDGGGSFFAVLETLPYQLQRAVLCDIWDPKYCSHGFSGHEHIVRDLKKLGRSPELVEFLDGYSTELIPKLAGSQFDLITIDGGHTPDVAAADLENCWSLLASGGMLAFDDVGHPEYRYLEKVLLDFLVSHRDTVLIPEETADWRNCALLVKS